MSKVKELLPSVVDEASSMLDIIAPREDGKQQLVVIMVLPYEDDSEIVYASNVTAAGVEKAMRAYLKHLDSRVELSAKSYDPTCPECWDIGIESKDPELKNHYTCRKCSFGWYKSR